MLGPVLAKNFQALRISLYFTPVRYTFIFKHAKYLPPTQPGKEQRNPYEKIEYQKYIVVKDTNVERLPMASVIFTKDVDGIAAAGEQKMIISHMFREYYQPQGLAVYATRFNVRKYSPLYNKQDETSAEEENFNDNLTAEQRNQYRTFFTFINAKAFPVTISLEQPWTLQKFHLRVSLRLQDVHVDDNQIVLSKETVTGPDMILQNRLFRFYIVVDKRVVIPCCGRYQHVTNKSYKQMLTPSLPDPTMVTDELLTNVNMIEEDLYIHPEEISMADSDIWDMMQTKMEEKKEEMKRNPPKMSQREQAYIEAERKKKREAEIADLYRQTFTYERVPKIPIDKIADPILKRMAMYRKRRYRYWDDDLHVWSEPLGKPRAK